MRILIIFLSSLMAVIVAEAATTGGPRRNLLVEVEGERLSVKAGDVLLKVLLSEIQAKSGIVIELNDSKAADTRSSIDFKNLPPALAFREILQDLNFAFFYSGTRLARVLILPRGDQIPKITSGLTNPDRLSRRFPRADKAALKSGTAPRLPGERNKANDVMAKLDAIEELEDSDDPKSIAALGEALSDHNRKVKEAALRALSNKKEAAATELLRRGLNDADPEFRIEVLESLAERRDLDSLRKAVADQNRDVRETAADLLINATTQK